jgi:hypothetical protein
MKPQTPKKPVIAQKLSKTDAPKSLVDKSTEQVSEKVCPKCLLVGVEFGVNKARYNGYQVYCRGCMKAVRLAGQYDKKRWESNREIESSRNKAYRRENADRLKVSDRLKASKRRAEMPGVIRIYNIARKHGEKRATPVWADKAAINDIYLEARKLQAQDGIARHVDHDVPLKHPLVCGLHVPSNLKVMAAKDNMRKHNAFCVA